MMKGFSPRVIATHAFALCAVLLAPPLSLVSYATDQSVVRSPEGSGQNVPEECVLGEYPTVSPRCGETVVVTQPIIRPGARCNPQTRVVQGECHCESEVCDCLLGEWPPEPECGDKLLTVIRPIARPATNGGKECPIEPKIVIPPGPCRCGDGILSEPEECDGNELGAFIDDIRSSRAIPPHVSITCSAACTLEVGPYCGDGVIQAPEQCDGSAFAADLTRPADMSAGRWGLKKCTADCRVEVPPDPCTEQTFVKEIRGCSHLCTRRLCDGASPTEVCGAAMTCAPCEGVKAVPRCTKTGGMVPGNNPVAGRVNFFTYGKDGKTVCFSESCLRPSRSFDPSALITLVDGSVKAARDLRATDALLGRSGQGIRIKEIFESGEEHPLYRITAGSHSVTITEKHVVWTTGGLRQAKDLRKGDRVTVRDGSLQPLTTVERLPIKLNQKAIGIWVEGEREEDRLIFGGGILVGDYGLEKELDR